MVITIFLVQKFVNNIEKVLAFRSKYLQPITHTSIFPQNVFICNTFYHLYFIPIMIEYYHDSVHDIGYTIFKYS